MAKKATNAAAAGVNLTLLASIANDPQGFRYVPAADGLPLKNFNPPLIEVNESMVDGNGNAAARITDEGREFLNANKKDNIASDSKPAFGLISGVVLPPSKRGNKGGGAKQKYPFDQMEIGQSFFVPVSEDIPEPVKTLGSTVSSMNMKYAQKTGETKEGKRAQKDPDGKVMKGPDGKKVMETAQVPVYKLTRKFVVRAAEKGVAYGDFTAPDNGAIVSRVPV